MKAAAKHTYRGHTSTLAARGSALLSIMPANVLTAAVLLSLALHSVVSLAADAPAQSLDAKGVEENGVNEKSLDEKARALILKYVATWEVASLFEEPTVSAALARLSDETREQLRQNLSVVGSIDVVSGHLSLSGNAPHRGTEEEAVLCMNPYGQQVDIAIFSKGTIRIFSVQKRYEWLPLCIKDWITGVNNAHQDRMRAPTNVVLEALPH